jgi:hypothetical protein
MDENRPDTPEQVVKFAPKERPRSYGTPAEEPGQAIIAKIQKADDLSNENCDRATALAQRLSMQFRAAEDRINRLEGGELPRPGGPRRRMTSDDPESWYVSDLVMRGSESPSTRVRRVIAVSPKSVWTSRAHFQTGARRTVLLQMAQVWQRLVDQYTDSSMSRRAPAMRRVGTLAICQAGHWAGVQSLS